MTRSGCSSRSAWRNRGAPFVPARFAADSSREARQPAWSRASRTSRGPRASGPMPRRSSLTGSRWPGSRARSGGPGRAAILDPASDARSAATVGVVAGVVAGRRRRPDPDGRVEQPDLDADDGWRPASSAAA